MSIYSLLQFRINFITLRCMVEPAFEAFLWSALEALDIDWIASLQDLIELGAREPEIHILCSESNVSFIN